MLGLMQDQPLLISSLITFAERHHGDGDHPCHHDGRHVHVIRFQGNRRHEHAGLVSVLPAKCGACQRREVVRVPPEGCQQHGPHAD